jgi:hypothetical protein
MRLVLEIILAAALIALAWEKSLKERASEISWVDKMAPALKKSVQRQHRPAATPAPTVSGAWMWDPNRKTSLDRPSPTIPPRQDSPPY